MDTIAKGFGVFDSKISIHKLSHYLPSQGPLKDFIHHNTLHAFQHLKFHNALHQASSVFGFKTYLSLPEYRDLYSKKQISDKVLDKILVDRKGDSSSEWKLKLTKGIYNEQTNPEIGKLRNVWKTNFKINPDKAVHGILFKVIGAFLDQGVSIWSMPTAELGFWAAIKEIEQKSFSSFFIVMLQNNSSKMTN